MLGVVNTGPVRAISAVTLLAAGLSLGGTAATFTDETALLNEIGFTAHEIDRIDRGEIVARTTEADSSAIALAVAGTVPVPAAFYLDRLRDIESFKQTPEVLQIGRFGRPPAASDMTALTLAPEDVDDLRSCRVGNCGFKLDARGIEALARKDAQVHSASAGLREHLAEYVRRYVEGGNGALMEYRDGSRPRHIGDDLRRIGDRSRYLHQRWPALFGAVFGFDGTLPPGFDHFLYWSKETIGPRPVVSVTHVIISPVQDGGAAFATKQIYASHYGNASLGVTMLFDRSTPEAPRTRVVYLNRSRIDLLGGLFGPIKRPVIRSRAREGAERAMRGLRDRLERQYAAMRKTKG